MSETPRAIGLLVLLVALPAAAVAGDGRVEISQARVLAAGGFPYTISQPGSYVLTSDLSVPAGVSGILLQTDRVFLDLNGFAILGPSVCQPAGACPPGAGFGIGLPAIAPFPGSRVTVVNGEVSGFGDNCVRLFEDARLERLVLRHCGANGAFVEGGSILIGNRVSNYGQFGLRMNGPATFSDNVLAPAGYGASPGTAYSGGVSGGGNVCGGPCAPPPNRRFYLTTTLYDGSQADNAGNCAAGFHFASLWEIHDVGALHYDTNLGVSAADAGNGPPSSNAGWIRSGLDSPVALPCSASTTPWSTTAGLGPSVFLEHWFSWQNAAELTSPWRPASNSCASPQNIWCVED